jgi:hypothetical protein
MSKKPTFVDVLVNGSQEINGEFHGDGYPLTMSAAEAAKLKAAGIVRDAPAPLAPLPSGGPAGGDPSNPPPDGAPAGGDPSKPAPS